LETRKVKAPDFLDFRHYEGGKILRIIGKVKGKGEVFLLQAKAGPWKPRRLRLPDFLDFRHYVGGKVVTFTHRPFLPPGVFLVLIFRG
jgi:hypothetical protein